MNLDVATVTTPQGPFCIAVDGDAIIATSWTHDAEAMLARKTVAGPFGIRRRRDLGAITDSVRAYYAGDVTAVDAIRVHQRQGRFLDEALRVLRTVPAGHTVSYAELAALSGNPGAVRAAGSACARNNIPLFVPCHRVVRTGGSLGGFYYGVEAKRWLLEHEAASVAQRNRRGAAAASV